MRPLYIFIFAGFCISLFCASVCVAQSTKPAAQTPDIKFGTVSLDDFRRHPFLADTTAEAVVLFDFAQTTIDYETRGFVLITTVHRRIRILKKSALDRATVSLTLYRTEDGKETEQIESLEGASYNLTAGSTRISTEKFSPKTVVTERVSDQVSLQKFLLPNVREGSVIEYKYTRKTPFNVNWNPRSWSFQEDIPIIWSEYRITFINNFRYILLMQRYLPLAINETTFTKVWYSFNALAMNAETHRFAVANAPALGEEAYTTTRKDCETRIDFELSKIDLAYFSVYERPIIFPIVLATKTFSGAWANLDKTLLDDDVFGKQYTSAKFLTNIANNINQTTPATDTLARLRAAQRAISQTINWDETNSYYSESLKKAFQAGKGGAGDINLTLVALLRKMGYDANPVVLSTRDHGTLNRQWALLKQLNYVVAHVTLGGKDLLLDASDPYLTPGILPFRALNGIGRLILPDTASRFVPLTPTERDTETITAQFTLQPDGSITGTVARSLGGYRAYKARKAFKINGEADYLAEMRKKFGDWQIEKATFLTTNDTSKLFKETYQTRLTDGIMVVGDRMYIQPMLIDGYKTNPFKEPERLYPVDFGMASEETYTATFTLPKGYQVDELPKPVTVALPASGGRFMYQATVDGQTLQIASHILLRKPVYYAKQYATLRALFAQIIATQAEIIVLKKK